MRKTWKKSIAMACAAAMVMTGTNWPVMSVVAAEENATTRTTQYTAEDRFQFPTTSTAVTLEAEHMIMHDDNTNDAGYKMEYKDNVEWASNKCFVNAMQPGGSNGGDYLELQYTAEKAGIYTATAYYRSGNANNGLYWEEFNGKIQAGDVTIGANDSARETHTGSFKFYIPEAGDGTLYLHANTAAGGPQLDKFDISYVEGSESQITNIEKNWAREAGVSAVARVTATDADAKFESSYATVYDGNRTGNYAAYRAAEDTNDFSSTYIQLDLGAVRNIDTLRLYRYADGRMYYSTTIVLSETEEGFATDSSRSVIYNSDKAGNAHDTTLENQHGFGVGTADLYQEDGNGLTVNLNNTVAARYVRIYGCGSNSNGGNSSNHIYEIEVIKNQKAIKAVEGINASVSKTVYAKNSTFDMSTLSLNLVYNDKTTAPVTGNENVTVTGDDFSSTGDKMLTVSYLYEGTTYTTNITVQVVEPGSAKDPTNDYPLDKLTVTAGGSESAVLNVNNDGNVYAAFDGNENTKWHTSYNTSNFANQAWVVMKFEEATVVDAVRWLSHNGNGAVGKYEVYGTTDDVTIAVDSTTNNGNNSVSNESDISWTKLCSGTWTKDSNWHLANFPATELKAIKVKVLEGFNNYANAKEIRVRIAESVESNGVECLGGSLKKMFTDETNTTVDYTKTALRFGYTFPTSYQEKEASAVAWTYYAEASKNNPLTLEKSITELRKVDNEDGTYTANLLIGGDGGESAIPSKYYDQTCHTSMSVTYGTATKNSGGDYTADTITLYSQPIEKEHRSVMDVAEKLTGSWASYGAGIIEAGTNK